MTGNVAARTVPLSKRGERIVLDVAQGFVRVAHYEPEYKKVDGKVRQSGEKRTTAKKRTLTDALVTVLGEADSKQDPLTVEAYIRATPWGRELP